MSVGRHQLGQPAAMILDGMVWLESGRIPMPWHRSLVAYASGHLPRAGAFKGYVAKLKACELVSFPAGGGLVLEYEGRRIAAHPAVNFNRLDYWKGLDGHLAPAERAIVTLIRERGYGAWWPRSELRAEVPAELSDQAFRQATAKLLAVSLLEVEGDCYRATEVLYPRGIFERRADDAAVDPDLQGGTA